MSLGIKVSLKKTGDIYDVYAIILKKSDNQKIYLLKGLSGATKISYIIESDNYSLLSLTPGMDPEERIAFNYKWIHEDQLTFLSPKDNATSTPFLLKDTW